MSLVEQDVEIEEGEYGDLQFMLRLLYDRKTNEWVGGVVYLREKQNRIGSVELLINPSTTGLYDSRDLRLAAAKCNFEIKDLKGLDAEIARKIYLINILKRSPSCNYEYSGDILIDLPRLLERFPELLLPKYYEGLPEPTKMRIKNYLETKRKPGR